MAEEGQRAEANNDGLSPQDPLLDENSSYDTAELVRPIQDWEISRDYLIFGEIQGLDTGKHKIIHFLEPKQEGVHGGVLLVAAGNTVQLLTLAPLPAPGEKKSGPFTNTVLDQQYLFGFGGSGIGSLAVHPTRRFFAVGEKGIKPNISIYRYPNPKVCRVLRNGTEFAYSSVVFSQDGEKLASVGCAPDYLLTVWNWRQEQTILRCKAFGQDVFSVQFAPTDSGFLTTSGVGHIRLWKMAATFTGLKLQGDIGKFGKSELSDIEAFCVLPDKKVLSGTERGVLLLWDGNFIKCEIMTSRRHLPHNGAINVVDYDAAGEQIVTAGKDGNVKFWSFEEIDRADIPPDDTVALMPMKRQILIEPRMNIRAVIKESDSRYLIQDGAGGVHLLTLDGDEHHVAMHYLANQTGRMTGIVCSPYEHVAASCGEDGSIRAWDYVSQRCLFATMAEQSPSTTGIDSGTEALARAAATAITWVPNAAALTTDKVGKSRQVVVGFSDGLVRVFFMDLAKRMWIRTNVFKPHSNRITCLSFSTSGKQFVTASEDGTFFHFKIVPSTKSSKYSTYPPEYEPLGFQRVPGGVVSVSWRPDDEAVLVTLANGRVIEYFLPPDGLDHLKNNNLSSRAENVELGDGSNTEQETYERHLQSREFAPFQRNRHMSIKELEDLEAQSSPSGNNPPYVEEKIRNHFQIETRAPSPNARTALYATNKNFYLSCQPPFHGALFVCQFGQSLPQQELASEETGHIETMMYSTSKRFLLCGLSNGKFHVRSIEKPHAFLTGEFHDGSASTNFAGKLFAAMSFDDSFVLTAGSDGNLSICRLHSETMEHAARVSGEKFENLCAQAKIVADQAHEKQQTQLDLLQKAMADSKDSDEGGMMGGNAGGSSGNELGALPAFHAAKAYAAYLEAQLARGGETPSVAVEVENFRGVVRLMHDPKNTVGLPKAISPLEDVKEPESGIGQLLEVPDIGNPREAYTIEDAKRKSEEDAKASATKSKQDRTRDVLAHMRQQLQDLKALDASYPSEHRLDEEEWEIDLDYSELLMKKGDAACEEVRKELAYAVEREELLLMKIREMYVSPLAVELITLHAFESGLCVQSFRTMKMPTVLQKRLNEIHTNEVNSSRGMTKKGSFHSSLGTSDSVGVGITDDGMGKSLVQRKPSVLHIMAKDTALDGEFPLKEDERKLLQHKSLSEMEDSVTKNINQAKLLPPGVPTKLHDGNASSGASVHGFEARKRLRADRKARLAHWMSNKPGEDADDPRDLVAIAFAQRNMGDYKLKTAANYVVPEDQRVNAAKKRRQMALLEEKLYEARLSFNAKVLELRELKLLLINELKRDQDRLNMLHQQLAMEGEAVITKTLEVDLSEWPEQRERVTDADIELYMREKKILSHYDVSTTGILPSSRKGASVNGRDEVVVDGKRVQFTDRSIAALSRKLHRGTGGNTDADGTMHKNGDGLRVRHVCIEEVDPSFTLAPESQPNNLDIDDRQVRIYLAKKEVLKLEQKKHEEVTAFDAAIAHLRHEKMKLEVIFKKCELQLFTLLSELMLLEQFESKENLLSSKLERNKAEKAQIMSEISEIQENLTQKRKELDEWNKQEKLIQNDFLTLVNGPSGSSSSQHPNFAALQKIFKKKIKRPKKKAGSGASGKDGTNGSGGNNDPSGDKDNPDDDEDEDDEEDDDDDYDDDDDDEDDDEDDVCPPGCDLQLYEKVLATREKRADIDDAMNDLTKAIEELKKSNDRQVSKQRQIDKELQATELDIQQFQSEKQMRFNQLDVVLALSKEQIECLVPSTMPSSTAAVGSVTKTGAFGQLAKWVVPEQATSCLVFTMRSFHQLVERIESLQKENRSLRQQFKDLHKQQNVLSKEKKVQQETIAHIQERCDRLQLLKFGQLVDIELLDKACDTTRVHALQAKVRVKEIESERELMRTKQNEQQMKRQILQATEQNTMLLSQIAHLNERQAALEKELNQVNVSQSVLQDDTELLEKEMNERNKLVKLVKLQARELEALKQEIGLLRGKDGKIYAPRL